MSAFPVAAVHLKIVPDLVKWFAKAMDYLDPAGWEFRIDKEGRPLPGLATKPRPEDFDRRWGDDCLEYGGFSAMAGPEYAVPRSLIQLTSDRDNLHRDVTGALQHWLGREVTNKRLAKIRKRYNLELLP